MRQKMTDSQLNDLIKCGVARAYNSKEYSLFCNFLETERSKTFVRDVDRLQMKDLLNKYGLTYMKKMYSTDFKLRELMRSSIRHMNIVDYTGLNTPPQSISIKRVKVPIYMKKAFNKSRIREIEIKNCFRRKGQAATLYGYELHKIRKWEQKHPKPTDEQLKQDLFPDLLLVGWSTKRNIALEHIRDMLCEKYCNYKKVTPYWKLYGVFRNKTTCYEAEIDRLNSSYVFDRMSKDESGEVIIKHMQHVLHKQRDADSANECLCLKLYNNSGDEIYKVAA